MTPQQRVLMVLEANPPLSAVEIMHKTGLKWMLWLTLMRLEGSMLIESRWEMGTPQMPGGPRRLLYGITEDGQRELLEKYLNV